MQSAVPPPQKKWKPRRAKKQTWEIDHRGRSPIDVDLPLEAHAGESEHGADDTDVLHVVHQLAQHLAELPREREPLGKLQLDSERQGVVCVVLTKGETRVREQNTELCFLKKKHKT